MGILLEAGTTDVQSGGMGGLLGIVLMYVVLIGAMWFFFMRPQNKEKKRVASMLASLEVGDVIMTTSGFYGVIISIEDQDNTVIVEFGSNKNCRIPMDRSAISRVEKPEEGSN